MGLEDDMTHADITVGIKAFERPECLFMALQSLVGVGIGAVIVADDSEDAVPTREVVDVFAGALDITYIRLPFDTGLSEGRNQILRHVDSELFLLLDDDQLVIEGLAELKGALLENPVLGGISFCWMDKGSRFCDAGHIRRYGGFVYRGLIAEGDRGAQLITDDVRAFDFIPNSTLFRTDVFRDLVWDPEYKIGAEHLDFYLRAKESTSWQFAIHERAHIWHVPLRGLRYRVFRDREAIARDRFREKQKHRGILVGASWMRRRCGGMAVDFFVRLGVPAGVIALCVIMGESAVRRMRS